MNAQDTLTICFHTLQMLSNAFIRSKLIYAFVHFHMLSYAFICFHTLFYAFIHFYRLSYAFTRFHTLYNAFICLHTLTYAYIRLHMLTYAYIRFDLLSCTFICMLKSLNLLICCIMSSLEQQEEILHLCLTGFTLRKPVKTFPFGR